MRWITYVVMGLIGAVMAIWVDKKTSNQIKEIYQKINYELVLFSSPICTYCTYFEKNIIPFYQQHQLAKEVPIRSVNMEENGTGPYHLSSPIKTLPTIIIMKNGQETGRLNGITDKLFFLAFVRDHTMK